MAVLTFIFTGQNNRMRSATDDLFDKTFVRTQRQLYGGGSEQSFQWFSLVRIAMISNLGICVQSSPKKFVFRVLGRGGDDCESIAGCHIVYLRMLFRIEKKLSNVQ